MRALLDNRIHIDIVYNKNSKNIIFCRPIKESLDNIGFFTVQGSEFIYKYAYKDGMKMLVTDIVLENGEKFSQVPFEIVFVEQGDLPKCTFNPEKLKKQFLSEQEKKTFITKPSEPKKEKIEDKVTIREALLKQKQLQEQEHKLFLEKKALEEHRYKQQVLNEKSKELEKKLLEKVASNFETYKEKFLLEFKNNSKKELDEYVLNKINEDLKTSLVIDKKINELVDKAENIEQIKESFKGYVDTAAKNILNEAKRFTNIVTENSGGGGGGTNAIQLAGGGTIDGNLTVTGVISTGSYINNNGITSNNWNDAFTSVYANSASWGTGGVAQTLSYNNQATSLLGITFGNTISLSGLRESVNVKDYGAKGDGSVDDWLAIQRTLSAAAGINRVYIPAGLYFISRELKIPSNSYVYGAGIGTTVIKLSASANATQCVMTNSENTRSYLTNLGNTNIVIKDLELDGNVSRFPGSYSPVGDTSGTGLCLAFVQNALVERVAVHDTCRHCFDICAPETSVNFNPLEYTPNPSFNVHLKDVIAYAAGDDNITTHFSHNILIENAYVPYTSGSEVPTNSNGIEIDDGSYDVIIWGGYVSNCIRGLEIKGHSWAPAAKRVSVYGLTCENNVRNFGFRHLGFDSTDSQTAFDIALYDCTSISPLSSTKTTDTPRALQISNYDGVYIKNFKVVGEIDAAFAVTVQERARNVYFDGMSFTSISGKSTGITSAIVNVDSTAARNITLQNLTFRNCIGLPIRAVGSVPGIVIDRVDAKTTLTPAPNFVIDISYAPSVSVPYSIKNVTMSGYLSAYSLGSVNAAYPTPVDVGLIQSVLPANASAPVTVASFGWREGASQGLNAGVGTKVEFTGSVVSGVSSNNNIPVAFISTEKINGDDNDLRSNLNFGVLSANEAIAVNAMTISPSGFVGLGTTTPLDRLTVFGSISTNSTIKLGVTGSAPLNTVTPIAWTDIYVDNKLYKMPLYQ